MFKVNETNVLIDHVPCAIYSPFVSLFFFFFFFSPDVHCYSVTFTLNVTAMRAATNLRTLVHHSTVLLAVKVLSSQIMLIKVTIVSNVTHIM